MFPTDNDINRLIEQSNGEKSFFYLALFSFIEGYIKKNYSNVSDYSDFPTLLYKVINERKKNNCSRSEINNYHNIIHSHKLTNYVRHQFDEITKEELLAAISMFIQFIEDQEITSSILIDKLKIQLKSWEEHEYISDFVKYKEIMKSNKVLENNLLIKIKELEQYKIQNNQLASKIKYLESINNKESDNAQEILELKKKLIVSSNKEKELIEIQKYISEMSRMLVYTKSRRDFESIVLRLSSEQSRILNLINLEHDEYIKGAPGTGKSLLLIKLLENNYNKSIILLTYNKALKKYNEYLFKLHVSENILNECTAKIGTVDSFLFNSIIHLFKNKRRIELRNNENDLVWFMEKGLPKGRARDYSKEIYDIIWPNLLTKEEYLSTKLSTFKEEKKKDCWNYMLELCEYYRNCKTDVLFEYCLYSMYTDNIEITDDYKIDYLIIDEVQDLDLLKLILLKKFVRKSVVFSGDMNQAIIQKGLNWKKIGFSFQGHTHVLKCNFRNTYQINEFAKKYRNNCQIQDNENVSESFRMGPIPEVIESEDMDDTYNLITDLVHLYVNTYEYSYSNICVIVPAKDDMKRITVLLKIKENIDCENISSKEYDFSSENKLCLSTPTSIKGIDFPVVILVLNKVLRQYVGSKNFENTVYTSMTRAMDILNIIIPKESRWGEIKAFHKNKEKYGESTKKITPLNDFFNCYEQYLKTQQ